MVRSWWLLLICFNIAILLKCNWIQSEQNDGFIFHDNDAFENWSFSVQSANLAGDEWRERKSGNQNKMLAFIIFYRHLFLDSISFIGLLEVFDTIHLWYIIIICEYEGDTVSRWHHHHKRGILFNCLIKIQYHTISFLMTFDAYRNTHSTHTRMRNKEHNHHYQSIKCSRVLWMIRMTHTISVCGWLIEMTPFHITTA